MRSSLSLLFALLMLSSVATAQNVTLWDQQPDPASAGIIDQAFGDAPVFSTFQVHDATFGSSVVVDTVTLYFTNNSMDWPQSGNADAIFNIFADDGSLDTEDLLTGSTVSAAFSVSANGLEFTASGLNLNLSAGTYWFGLTPLLDNDPFGQEFSQAAVGGVVGNESEAINPGGGFGIGTDWLTINNLLPGSPLDGAITITGQAIPEPTTAGLLILCCVGLVTRRRR